MLRKHQILDGLAVGILFLAGTQSGWGQCNRGNSGAVSNNSGATNFALGSNPSFALNMGTSNQNYLPQQMLIAQRQQMMMLQQHVYAQQMQLAALRRQALLEQAASKQAAQEKLAQANRARADEKRAAKAAEASARKQANLLKNKGLSGKGV
jgi:hypothetical protein